MHSSLELQRKSYRVLDDDELVKLGDKYKIVEGETERYEEVKPRHLGSYAIEVSSKVIRFE